MATQKRVLLKISGECMSGIGEYGFDTDDILSISNEISDAVKQENVQLAIVIGGGNMIRGSKLVKELGLTPVIADHAGMLATIINSIVLQDFLEKNHDIQTRVCAAVEVNVFAEPYRRRRAINHLVKGRVVILAGGTGNPRFTTDTASVLRAIELEANMVIKGTKVDGIFDKDPEINNDAEYIEKISHADYLKKELEIIDRTAVTLAYENGVDIRVFNILKEGNLKKVLSGENIGSLISS